MTEVIGPAHIDDVGDLFLTQRQMTPKEMATDVAFSRAPPTVPEKTEAIGRDGHFELITFYPQLDRELRLELVLKSAFREGLDMEYFNRLYDLVSGKAEIIHWAIDGADNITKLPKWLTEATIDIQEWVHAKEVVLTDFGPEIDLPRNVIEIEYHFPDYAPKHQYTDTGLGDSDAFLGTIATHLSTIYRNHPNGTGS